MTSLTFKLPVLIMEKTKYRLVMVKVCPLIILVLLCYILHTLHFSCTMSYMCLKCNTIFFLLISLLRIINGGSYGKDYTTGMVFLQGLVNDGFFPLQSSSTPCHSSVSSPTALISNKASIKVWHSRLGHPSSSIFKKVLSTT